MGFKDTGIFVKDYVSIKEDNTQTVFLQEEKVNVLRATDRAFIVHKDGVNHEVPQDMILQIDKKTNKYLLIEDSILFDSIGGQVVGNLNKGAKVELLEVDGQYGYFLMDNGAKVYIELKKTRVIMEENITPVILDTDLMLIQNEKFLNVEKGKEVNLKNYKEGKYIIIDEDKNEFEVMEEYIELKRRAVKTSRSGGSKRDEAAAKIVEAAHKEVGKPYIYASAGPKGFDCSGLTTYLFSNNLGIKLNRSSRDQAKNGVEVSKANLLPGDLVFFKTTGANIGHVGVYIGNNNMIHASSGRKKVMISSLDETYYKTRYVTARRVIND